MLITMAGDNDSSNILGRKVFFLYPSAVIQNQIITELAQQEIEVYTSKDPGKLRGALRKFSGSVAFVNLNDQMSGSECEAWIRAVLADPATSKTDIGVLSNADDKALQQKYAETYKLRGGFILIKASAIVQSIKQILLALRTLDAKGRRKYVRVELDDDSSATVNLPVNNSFAQGHIKDISVVGFSCFFNQDPALQKNSRFPDIQIKLQSMILKVEGVVYGSRMDGSTRIYVVIFNPQRIAPEAHTKIRQYIQQNLQAKMDKELG
jgi:hypothetical protein